MASDGIEIGIRSNFPEVARKLARIQADLQDKVMGAALNKTIDKGRVEMKRRIVEEFNVSAKDVNAQLSVKRSSAKAGILQAALVAFSKRGGRGSRNVMLFSARQEVGNGETKRVVFQGAKGWATRMVKAGGGVSVQIKRGGGRRLIKGAFIANKGRTVFVREGKSRLPIKGVETIDVPSMFNTRRINESVVKRMKEEFPVEFERAMKLYKVIV